MDFSENDKKKAIAIVKIFETGRPIGNYAAISVLSDGAGLSYGAYQLTHRSGSLAAAVERYLASGPADQPLLGGATLTAALPALKDRSAATIAKLSRDQTLKQALRDAAAEPSMRSAQDAAANDRYMLPALAACGERGFSQALSLAVIYDSLIHGSFQPIAQRVRRISAEAEQQERAWITEYVRRRHAWLSGIARLKATSYRTKFFMDQIATGNWDLRLPLNVRGIWISERSVSGEATSEADDRPSNQNLEEQANTAWEFDAEASIAAAAERFDSAENLVNAISARSDRAKSLWTTIGGSVTQGAWGIFGYLAGIPRTFWIVVAVFAGILTLLYLYRQIELGKIRERAALTGRMMR